MLLSEFEVGRLLNLCNRLSQLNILRGKYPCPPKKKLKAVHVIDVLSDLFTLRGVPIHIRSDKGPEFIAKALCDWGARTAYIMPGSLGRTAIARASTRNCGMNF